MARGPRVRSEAGIYHITMRGNGRQHLFEVEGDRRVFLLYLTRSLAYTSISLIAWCLMGNHVHLLIEDPNDEMSDALQRLGCAYASHFNRFTGHVGSVFQGRFGSVPITSDRQLLQVVRYIHDNPLKAGVEEPSTYEWSSYRSYAGDEVPSYFPDVDTRRVMDLLGEAEGFAEFSRDDSYAGYVERRGTFVSDEDVLAAARDTLGEVDLNGIKQLPPNKRRPLLQALRNAGLTIRQIERVTGIGRSTISHSTHRT